MTISPYTIAEEIQTCQDTIDSLVAEIRKAGADAAYWENRYEREFAQARLRARAAEGPKRVTEDMAKDQAVLDTSEIHLQHMIYKNNLTTLRAALSAVEHKMDGYRTQAASVRVAGG